MFCTLTVYLAGNPEIVELNIFEQSVFKLYTLIYYVVYDSVKCVCDVWQLTHMTLHVFNMHQK